MTMRKAILSVWAVLAILGFASLAWADDEPKADPADKQTVEERQQQRKEALEAAMVDKEFDKAISLLDEMINDKDVADDEKFMAEFTEFVIQAKMKNDGAKACPLAKKLAETKKDDAQILNELAWTILDTPDLKDRDLDVAMDIAKRAAEVSKEESSAILDTLARAYIEKGDVDKAIEYQTKAVEKSANDEELNNEEGEAIKTQIKETLEKYKAKKAEAK
jgi:tetratricopeptide (TPR) repeat protein